MDSTNENIIEWIKGSKTASVTLSQEKYKTKLEKLAKTKPDECQILEHNADGSIFAHLPLSWIKISPPRACSLSEEQLKQAGERLRKMRKS